LVVIANFYGDQIGLTVKLLLENKTPRILENYQLSDITYDISFTPLSARFEGKGVILTLKKSKYSVNPLSQIIPFTEIPPQIIF